MDHPRDHASRKASGSLSPPLGRVRAGISAVVPTLEHQALVILMTESPRLAPLIRHRAFGLDLPLDVDVLPGPEISRDLRRPDLIVDGTVLVHDGPPSRREGFAMEAQRQPDEEKRMSWPVQVAGLRRRLGCPVTLVVVTCSERTARWAEEPIDLGRGRGRMVLSPLVIGPRQIPRVVTREEALAHPDLAVLAIIAHGRKGGSEHLGRVAIEGVLGIAQRGDPRATLLFDMILAFLDRKVLARLEHEMGLSRS